MSYQIYSIIHFSGIFLVLMSLASLGTLSLNGALLKGEFKGRKLFYSAHGLGLFLILLGGFGMLARLGIHWPWPSWITVKFAVWILLGGVVALIARFPSYGKILWSAVFLLALTAAYTATFKLT